jgi:putative resolvase
MRAKEVMTKYNICRETLCRWVKEGKINYTVKPSGRYEYSDIVTYENKTRKNVIYARCSTSGQKENLERQIERLKTFSTANGFVIDEIYQEIASALNYNRKQYRKLFEEIINNKIERVIIEYKDRLLRIGFDDFKALCDNFNVELIVIDNSEDKTKHQEITEDLISIVNDLSYKMYSTRKRKKIENTLVEPEEC